MTASLRWLSADFGALPSSIGDAPVSIVLIATETSSMWPNSSAAMFAMSSKNGRAAFLLRKLKDWYV